MNRKKIQWADGDPKYEIKPLNPKNWSQELHEFVMALMHKDPKMRLKSDQTLETPFLQLTIKALKVRKSFLKDIKPVEMQNIQEIGKYKTVTDGLQIMRMEVITTAKFSIK